jgi:hypothetical protein
MSTVARAAQQRSSQRCRMGDGAGLAGGGAARHGSAAIKSRGTAPACRQGSGRWQQVRSWPVAPSPPGGGRAPALPPQITSWRCSQGRQVGPTPCPCRAYPTPNPQTPTPAGSSASPRRPPGSGSGASAAAPGPTAPRPGSRPAPAGPAATAAPAGWPAASAGAGRSAAAGSGVCLRPGGRGRGGRGGGGGRVSHGPARICRALQRFRRLMRSFCHGRAAPTKGRCQGKR